MKHYFSQHPVFVFYDAKKRFLLLAIPILRIIFFGDDLYGLVMASMRDAALALLLIWFSVMKWRKTRYSLKDGLTLRQGVISKHVLRIMSQHAASIEVECTPLMWLCGARRVRINTAGLRSRADATLYLPAKMVAERTAASSRRARRYAARVFPVAVMAASSSNAAIGFLTLVPALRNAGKIIGRDVQSEFAGLVGRMVSLGLPPLMYGLANILVLGWCFAFVRGFAKFAGFFAERDGDQLHLTSGLITRREVYIDCVRITTLDLRQTLFMRIFRLYSVSIAAAGYGRDRASSPIIIPAARKRELSDALDSLLPEYPSCTGVLRPGARALPASCAAPLFIIAAGFFPLFAGGVWISAAAIMFTAGVWWLSIRLSAFTRSGFGISRDAVSIRYAKGLALHEVHVPIEVADCIMVKQAPWQRRTCSVTLFTYGEARRRHRVKGLPAEAVTRMMSELRERHIYQNTTNSCHNYLDSG